MRFLEETNAELIHKHKLDQKNIKDLNNQLSMERNKYQHILEQFVQKYHSEDDIELNYPPIIDDE